MNPIPSRQFDANRASRTRFSVFERISCVQGLICPREREGDNDG